MTSAHDIARFFLTHHEASAWAGEPLTKPNPIGAFEWSIEPSNPKGLLPASAEHLERRIEMWAKALKESSLAD